MKQITEVNAKRSFAGPGVYAFDAEATIWDSDTGDEVYVHVNLYDMFRHYTVGNASLMGDDIVETEYSEEYERMSDAKGSEYYKVFDMLNKVLTRMEKSMWQEFEGTPT